MIVEFIVVALMTVLAWLFSFLNFIALPTFIVQGLAQAVDFMMLPFGVISNYIGPSFLANILLVILGIFPIIYAWKFIVWVLTKLKVIG